MPVLAPVRDPRTGRIIAELPLSVPGETAAFAGRCREASARWGRVPVARRAALVASFADVLAGRAPGLAAVFSRETGKTVAEAAAELDRAVEALRWTAAAAVEVLDGRDVPGGNGLARRVAVEPAGPALAIVPSNFPAVVAARKVGPALAAGCAVVLKGPETTPSVIRAFAAAAHEAGIPAEVLQTAFTTAEGAGALAARPEFRTVSFTGSTRTGRLVAAAAAGNLASCVLELGGHAPAIICADADLDQAVRALTPLKWGTAGQSCAAPSRFLVHESLAGSFAARFAAAAPEMDHRGGTLGPLHTLARREEVHALSADAVARGADLVIGGFPPQDTDGFHYPATILTGVREGSRILSEEPFGPLAPIVAFATDAEAIALANATPYALGAFVFAAPAHARHLAPHLEAGRVCLNCATGADPDTPLSGRFASGHGYEGGPEGILAFTRLKTLTSATR